VRAGQKEKRVHKGIRRRLIEGSDLVATKEKNIQGRAWDVKKKGVTLCYACICKEQGGVRRRDGGHAGVGRKK